MEPRETLETILRPAGGGVYVVSTGVAEQAALQRRIYGLPDDADAAAIMAGWQRALDGLAAARIVVLGVPSDTGAGFTRGANRAPAALRARLLEAWPAHPLRAPGVVDVGDVRVVPQLLTDAMLAPEQIEACRRALYGDARAALPVAPLDLTERALDLLAALAPQALPIVLGGDHSVGWPAFRATWRRVEGPDAPRPGRLGVLHFDAHTDLLPHRLGVEHCFATWAWHANETLGRDGRLVQVGIRASGHPRAHWERTLGVRQFWAHEVAHTPPAALADTLVAHFRGLGCTALYLSNDIDGTDAAEAAATGTPEPGGLSADLVAEVIARVGAALPIVGADLVEVAPPLAHGLPGEPARTLDVGLRYLARTTEAMRAHNP